MMVDIFEGRSPNIDSQNNGFHSINNDASLSDINCSSGNVLSEINVYNSKDANEI